jgi:hypothetical protein
MSTNHLPSSPGFKLDLMFEGIRYSEALGRAGEHSSPSYTFHKVAPGEYDPRGTGKVALPLVLVTEDDDIHCRVRVEADSPWVVGGSREQGYTLVHEGRGESRPVQFEPNRESGCRGPPPMVFPALLQGSCSMTTWRW